MLEKSKENRVVQPHVTHGHSKSGSLWDPEAAKRYASTRHGADGDQFLDPYFLSYLRDGIIDQLVADIGCGACPWSIEAMQSGAKKVHAIDNAKGMIQQASAAISKAGLSDKIEVVQGDANDLPFSVSYFDKALSINVGCNLVSLENHLIEISRVLNAGGEVIITAPAHFDTLFTDGTKPQAELAAEINRRLEQLPEDPSFADFQEQFNSMNEVLRATFAKIHGKWQLVTDENLLEDGQEIYRKIPGLIVPNRYHAAKTYLEVINQISDLKIERTHLPCFNQEADWETYSEQNPTKPLGKEYIGNNPFLILVAKKL